MASAFSHAVVAVAVGKALADRGMPPRFWLLSILCSILPDADVFGFWLGIPYGDLLGHRGLTHSLSFAVILSLVVVHVWFRDVRSGSRRWWLLVTHFFLVTASHGVLDAMTNGGLGIAFFAPFDKSRYFLPWTPVKVSPIGVKEFFNPYGVQVLVSEFMWIWIPVGLFVLGVVVFRRARIPGRSTAMLILIALLIGGCAARHSASPAVADDHPDPEEEQGHQHHVESVESMTSEHVHLGPHFKWTGIRPPNPVDRQRAGQIVATLRNTLARYKDYRIAVKDGYTPFLPDVLQPRYHFTNKWRAFKGAFRFNPAEPTSLLYKKTPEGYELIGAMYTAPKRMSEDQLNERIPLSVGQWHAHVNICLPPRSEVGKADPAKFGFKGSIVTKEECRNAEGRFYPQIFGWMLHVYPFENTPDKIWTH